MGQRDGPLDGQTTGALHEHAVADDQVGPAVTRRSFTRCSVRLDPGEHLPYLAEDWRDCLVVVEAGEVELETTSGLRHTCRAGDVLWLAGLPLRRLANRGGTPTVIVTVRRNRPVVPEAGTMERLGRREDR